MNDEPSRAWMPDSLHDVVDRADLAQYSYVVLEELIQGNALLIAWPWPDADPVGLPRWRDLPSQPAETAVEQAVLRAQLYTPSGLRREPRVGDVFAVERLGGGWAEDQVDDVEALVEGSAYDITVDARAAAKLTYYGALTGMRAPAEIDRQAAKLRDADDRDRPVARLRTRAPLRPLEVRPRSELEEST
jgi:hypothetical protein